MKVVRSTDELRAELAGLTGSSMGFVPTMGALHSGHLSLVRLAGERCPVVTVSIFVNPLQFGPLEDLQRYPREEKRDLEVLEQHDVDLVFLPSVDEMYPSGRMTLVSVGELGSRVEGASRPGHFDGVATVVAKLFNLVQPDAAFFGQKDAQQVAVIRRMVTDLSIPLEIVVCPTIREDDGLAMSSRNVYLEPEQRRRAVGLWRALQAGRSAFDADADWDEVEKVMWESLVASGLDPDYAQAVDPVTFERPGSRSSALLVIAARAGDVRLIDNLPLISED
ncbi:MAG TPA: pantoate--beta-alanine ligase [Actinomycetota bacterium]|nr:pantoate--beta-alanine ligase [Actinomycetota bacterium]